LKNDNIIVEKPYQDQDKCQDNPPQELESIIQS
jgi:hypothetical protein